MTERAARGMIINQAPRLSNGLEVVEGVNAVLYAAVASAMAPEDFAEGFAMAVKAGDDDDRLLMKRVIADFDYYLNDLGVSPWMATAADLMRKIVKGW